MIRTSCREDLDNDLSDVTVTIDHGSAVIHTTDNHLIFDERTHRWTEAKDLRRGDHVRTQDGTTATVTSTTTVAGSADMWDLTVDSVHDFYVVVTGGTGVLVHNVDGPTRPGCDDEPVGTASGGAGSESYPPPIRNIPPDAQLRVLRPDPNGGVQYGIEYKWIDENGQTVRFRIHGPDGTAPPGSNSASGETYRVQVGRRYMDAQGNLHPAGVSNPNSPYYDPDAANATHIPWPGGGR